MLNCSLHCLWLGDLNSASAVDLWLNLWLYYYLLLYRLLDLLRSRLLNNLDLHWLPRVSTSNRLYILSLRLRSINHSHSLILSRLCDNLHLNWLCHSSCLSWNTLIDDHRSFRGRLLDSLHDRSSTFEGCSLCKDTTGLTTGRNSYSLAAICGNWLILRQR